MISNCIYADYNGLLDYIWSAIANIDIKIFCQVECNQTNYLCKWNKSYADDWVATIYIFDYLYYVWTGKHILLLQEKSVCVWMIYITNKAKLGNASVEFWYA